MGLAGTSVKPLAMGPAAAAAAHLPLLKADVGRHQVAEPLAALRQRQGTGVAAGQAVEFGMFIQQSLPHAGQQAIATGGAQGFLGGKMRLQHLVSLRADGRVQLLQGRQVVRIGACYPARQHQRVVVFAR